MRMNQLLSIYQRKPFMLDNVWKTTSHTRMAAPIIEYPRQTPDTSN